MKQGKGPTQPRRSRRALTPEAREDQLIAAAVDLAERQILEGTASPSVITHFLKLGSTKERLEKQLLEEQTKLANGKVEALKSSRRMEELYANAIKAMSVYNGTVKDDE